MAAAVLAAAALGAASAAQAHTDVQLSIGLPGLPVYVQREPVYVQSQPDYGPPPAVVYERPWRSAYRPDFEREREWRHGEWQRREWERREWQRREWESRHHHDGFRSHGRDRD